MDLFALPIKICKKCGQDVSISEFKVGSHICKSCVAAGKKAWQQKSGYKPDSKKFSRAYYEKNKEKVIAANLEYKKKNWDKQVAWINKEKNTPSGKFRIALAAYCKQFSPAPLKELFGVAPKQIFEKIVKSLPKGLAAETYGQNWDFKFIKPPKTGAEVGGYFTLDNITWKLKV